MLELRVGSAVHTDRALSVRGDQRGVGGCVRLLLGIFVLTGAIIGGSSIGTVANYMSARDPMLKNSWRYTMIVFLMSPLAIVELWKYRNQNLLHGLFTVKNVLTLICCSICLVLWSSALIYATLNTI